MPMPDDLSAEQLVVLQQSVRQALAKYVGKPYSGDMTAQIQNDIAGSFATFCKQWQVETPPVFAHRCLELSRMMHIEIGDETQPDGLPGCPYCRKERERADASRDRQGR